MKPRHTQPRKSSLAKRQTVMDVAEEAKSAGENKMVNFFLERPGARSVSVAGTFNNWKAVTPMSRDLEGTWTASVSLKPGRYEYRFVVDGQWLSDPNAQENVPNEFGSTNSVVIA